MRISLTALRAFEATARLTSMSLASVELRVGLASISRHVSALQARMGVELLRREGRRVVLTPVGRTYFAEITAAFNSINNATARIAGDSAPNGPRLAIACDRSFAQRWLMPRLADFCAQVPGLSLTLTDPKEAVETGCPPDITLSWRRIEVEVTPEEVIVAEPALYAMAASHVAPVSSLTALLRSHTLIHSGTRDLWRDWLAAAGHGGQLPRGGMLVSDKSMALDAASCGMGIALVCSVLAEPELLAGQCQIILPNGFALGRYVAARHNRPSTDPALIGRFIDWIQAEMREAISTEAASQLLSA